MFSPIFYGLYYLDIKSSNVREFPPFLSSEFGSAWPGSCSCAAARYNTIIFIIKTAVNTEERENVKTGQYSPVPVLTSPIVHYIPRLHICQLHTLMTLADHKRQSFRLHLTEEKIFFSSSDIYYNESLANHVALRYIKHEGGQNQCD